MWTAWLERTLARRRADPEPAPVPARRCGGAEPDPAQDETPAEHGNRGEALEPAEL